MGRGDGRLGVFWISLRLLVTYGLQRLLQLGSKDGLWEWAL